MIFRQISFIFKYRSVINYKGVKMKKAKIKWGKVKLTDETLFILADLYFEEEDWYAVLISNSGKRCPYLIAATLTRHGIISLEAFSFWKTIREWTKNK